MGRRGDGEVGRWGGVMGTESVNPHPLWPPSSDALGTFWLQGKQLTLAQAEGAPAGRWFPSILEG